MGRLAHNAVGPNEPLEIERFQILDLPRRWPDRADPRAQGAQQVRLLEQTP